MEEKIQAFIRSHPVARLATADRGGAPHVIPICYAFDGENLYFVVDEKPKKRRIQPLKRLRNIAENPRVAVIIDDYDDDWSQLAYVLITGEADTVEGMEEYEQALSLLRQKYPQYRRMALTPSRNPVVRIAPLRVHSWQAGEGS